MATALPGLDLGSSQPSNSAGFANPLQSTPLGNLSKSISSNLPQTYGGNPISSLLGYIPKAYADTTSTPNNGQNFSPVPNSSQPVSQNNGGGALSDLQKIGYNNLNPAQQSQYDLLSQQTNAAQSAYNAQNQSLNTQFDQSASDLNAQLPYLQQQRDSALSGLNLANQQATDQANSARLSAQTNTNDQINQAGDVAHQTQNQNRNILRALGIGGGTYAAELLSKPLNTYDQQRGQLGQALTQRMGQLDDYINGVTQQHAQAVSDLQNNYANLVGKIQSDLRFNDRQRNDALAAANSALQTNLANIQSSAQQYAQQVQLMKMQLAQSSGTVSNYTNPTYDPSQFSSDLLSNTGAGNQFSTGNLQALVPANQKKLDSNNPLQQDVNSGGLTLSGLGQ
jgi:hypothetical protein